MAAPSRGEAAGSQRCHAPRAVGVGSRRARVAVFRRVGACACAFAARAAVRRWRARQRVARGRRGWGRCWLVEGGGWNLADSVIRCARFVRFRARKIGRCRAAKNGLSTSFAHPSSRFWESTRELGTRCRFQARTESGRNTTPLALLAGARTAPEIPRFHKSSRGKNRAQDSNFVARARQNRGTSGTAPMARLADSKSLANWALHDFGTESKALQAPRFQRFERSSRSTTAPEIPRLHKSSRSSHARARQNRGRSRGQIPCRLRYSRALHCASRARRACACRCPSGAAARPAQPVRGFSSWRGEAHFGGNAERWGFQSHESNVDSVLWLVALARAATARASLARVADASPHGVSSSPSPLATRAAVHRRACALPRANAAQSSAKRSKKPLARCLRFFAQAQKMRYKARKTQKLKKEWLDIGEAKKMP